MADSPAPDCLTALVGLSRGQNACYSLPADPDKAAAITASLTGIYIDEVEGIRLASTNPAGDLYQQLEKARTVAVQQVRAAIEMARQGSYGIALYQRRGTLGGQGNGQLMPAGTRALMSFYTNARREGAWRVTRLQLFTDVAVTAAPLLLDGAQIAELTTSGSSGITTGLPADGLLIPLDGNRHTLEVILPDGVRVRQNNFFSGCFSCSRGTAWFSSVASNLQNVTASTPGNGFAISVNEECTADPDFLCFAAGSDDGRTVPRYSDIRQALALAIAHKAASVFLNNLLATNQLNRYTMLEPKELPALSDYLASRLTTPGPDGTGNWLNWLNSPNGLGQVQHPCFLGAPVGGPRKEWTL